MRSLARPDRMLLQVLQAARLVPRDIFRMQALVAVPSVMQVPTAHRRTRSCARHALQERPLQPRAHSRLPHVHRAHQATHQCRVLQAAPSVTQARTARHRTRPCARHVLPERPLQPRVHSRLPHVHRAYQATIHQPLALRAAPPALQGLSAPSLAQLGARRAPLLALQHCVEAEPQATRTFASAQQPASFAVMGCLLALQRALQLRPRASLSSRQIGTFWLSRPAASL